MDGIKGSYQQILSLHHTENAQPKRLKDRNLGLQNKSKISFTLYNKKSLDSIEKPILSPFQSR